MLTELGSELRSAREKLGASLQTIAESSRISIAYLQKLERGVVLSPSPHVLRRVAASTGLEYLRLMDLAGYLENVEVIKVQEIMSIPRPHPLSGRTLTQAEWQAVGDFIKTLIARRK